MKTYTIQFKSKLLDRWVGYHNGSGQPIKFLSRDDAATVAMDLTNLDGMPRSRVHWRIISSDGELFELWNMPPMPQILPNF